MTRVDICVCTFRRPALIDTLISLRGLELPPDTDAHIIVVDNDTYPSAKNTVETFAATAALPVRYVHCPAGNVSIARNGALHASHARFLAFIDDDELADPNWLAALLKRRAISGAAVVLGPVEPRFDADAAPWVRRAGLHATRPVWRDGEIRTGYTCNVLIDREHPALAGRRFDTRLGVSGGEDTDFFAGAHAAGARIAYAEDAVVTETVPHERARFAWLAKRRYRMGQTHAHILTKRLGRQRLANLFLAAGKAVACLGIALFSWPIAHRRNVALLRGTLHVGVFAGLAGHRPLRLYGLQSTAKGAAE